MRIILVILIVFMSFFGSYSQNNRLALILNQIEIKCENKELLVVLNKIVSHQQLKYGNSDTLYYEFLISKSKKNIRELIGNYESIYITGIDESWPMPSSAFKSVLGYIEFGNIIFIVSDGGGFPQDYFSNVFSIKGSEKIFIFKEFKNKEVDEDDDTVVRIWCQFFYKKGNIKLFDSSCRDNNGDLYLFMN
jgi:hypothetical protein